MDQQTLLKSIYLFRDATKDDLVSLAEIAESRDHLQGQIVFNEGDEADAMFVVEMGTIDIVPKGKELAIVTIGSGQSFGEMAFFSRGKRPASARARERSRLSRLPFDRLETLLADRPALAITFYRNACAFLAKHVRTLLSDLDRRYF
jgi:CRP/FNR family transcriptional regulator, cyclic AMP receptor protein